MHSLCWNPLDIREISKSRKEPKIYETYERVVKNHRYTRDTKES